MKGLQSFGESGLSEIITDNIINYIDFTFVKMGGYTDIQKPSPLSKLYKVSGDGKVWAAKRKNWIWEPGHGIVVDKVWVNGQIVTDFKVSYRDGCIYFNNPINSGALVEANYSYKYVHIYDADEYGVFNLDNNFEVDDVFINTSKIYFPDRRVQLPSIGIETLVNRTSSPYELGNYSQQVKTRVLCNILAADNKVAKRLADYLSYLQDRVIVLFDRDKAAEAGLSQNYDGTRNSLQGTYEYLSDNFPYLKAFARKASVSNIQTEKSYNITPSLVHITVRMTVDCIF